MRTYDGDDRANTIDFLTPEHALARATGGGAFEYEAMGKRFMVCLLFWQFFCSGGFLSRVATCNI